jgi:hypothetical protein
MDPGVKQSRYGKTPRLLTTYKGFQCSPKPASPLRISPVEGSIIYPIRG